MSDSPDDLTAVGRYHGNQPPPETSQTVRCPEGPDPVAESAQAASALYQLVRTPSEGSLQVRVHPPRAQVSADDEREEMGQFRTVDALRDALAEASVEGWTGVFYDAEAERVLTDEVSPDHAWIGQPRYQTITLFPDPETAAAYAETHAAPTDSQ